MRVPGLLQRRSLLVTGGLSLAGGWPAHAHDLSDLVARVKPSIALVGSYSATDSPRFNFFGTGFVVRDGNSLVTCAHVLQVDANPNAARTLAIQVWTDGRWEHRIVKSVAKDALRDLSVLSFDGAPVPALILADGDSVREGQDVLTVGFPIGGALGFSPVAHRGMVAARTTSVPAAARAGSLNERAIAQMRQGGFEVYQLDMTAYPGNSGGPLVNVTTGEVIGVVSIGLLKSSREYALSNPSGITYAVPAHWLKALRP